MLDAGQIADEPYRYLLWRRWSDADLPTARRVGYNPGDTRAMPTSATAITAEQMRLVLDVSRMLSVTADLDLLLHAIAQAVTALLNCERASIFLHDERHHEMWTKVALGSPEIRIPDGAGIVASGARWGQRGSLWLTARFSRFVA